MKTFLACAAILLFIGCNNWLPDNPVTSKVWRLKCPKCGRTVYHGPAWPETESINYDHVNKCKEGE